MKGIYCILFSLFVIGHNFCVAASSEQSDEEITRALIVVRLLNHINWQVEDFSSTPKPEFNLCIWNDRIKTRSFSIYLKDIQIQNALINPVNIKQIPKYGECQAIYLFQPESAETRKLFSQQAENKSIIVVEGKDTTEPGVHFNLYLNDQGFFDFDLNLEAFVKVNKSINIELLSLGNINSHSIQQKTDLLRFLLNYTEWPDENSRFKNSARLQICSFAENPFALLAQHYIGKRSIKGMPVRFQSVNSESELVNCDTLLVSQYDQKHLQSLMSKRQEMGLLIVGNSPNLGEQGVHYNLAIANTGQQKRFEINLMAFGLSQHIPNYQLLNSAHILKDDYPQMAVLISQIIQLTDWPGKHYTPDKSARPVQICLYQENAAGFLKKFLAQMLDENPSFEIIILSKEGVPMAGDCSVIFANGDLLMLIAKSVVLPPGKEVLVIANQLEGEQLAEYQKVAMQLPVHFNLRMKSKALTFEAILQNIQQSQFKPARSLLDAAIPASQAATNDGGASDD